MGRLRCQLFGRLLQVGRVELREITRHALLQLCAAPFHLPAREVLVAGVDGFELTPIDRNARCREQAHLAANSINWPHSSARPTWPRSPRRRVMPTIT